MGRAIKRTLLWTGAALLIPVLIFCALIAWPDPLFAYSLGTGKIVVASDRPIPSAGGERFLQDCERLLERSPLKAKSRRYRVYVTNESWRPRTKPLRVGATRPSLTAPARAGVSIEWVGTKKRAALGRTKKL